MSRLVTSPLRRLLESDLHMLEMNENYCKLVEYLDEQAEDPTKFLRGVITPFGMDSVNQDAFFPVFCEPLPSEELESLSYEVAKLALAGVAHLLKRMLADQLPGWNSGEKSMTAKCERKLSVCLKQIRPPKGFLECWILRSPGNRIFRF